MSTRLLYKAFFGRRYAPIVGVTLAICGLYGGYLLWFICQRYLPGPDAAAWHLAFLIGWMLCSFLALGRIPDALFTNRRLCAVRWLPVPGTLLVRLTLGHLLLLQGGIIALVFWGFFLHAEGGRASLLRLMLACLLCAALADLAIYLLALLASRVLSVRTLGYGFILLQYGGFFLLTALSVRGFLRLSTFPNVAHAATLTALSALLLCAALSHAATARWYERGVAKAQQFQRNTGCTPPHRRAFAILICCWSGSACCAIRSSFSIRRSKTSSRSRCSSVFFTGACSSFCPMPRC